MPLTAAQRTFYERTTPVYECTLVDEDEVAIPASALDSLTLTMHDIDSGEIINGRDSQSIKNANGGTVDNNGLLVLVMESDDTAIVGTVKDGDIERHAMTLEWTYNGGASNGKHRVELLIVAMDHVDATP